MEEVNLFQETCSPTTLKSDLSTCSSDHHMQGNSLFPQLVGPCNEGAINICGLDTHALIDSGSMVTCVSQSFF